jgi:hypothetical protein
VGAHGDRLEPVSPGDQLGAVLMNAADITARLIEAGS